jgi:SDR family mycofactocin-dependent oxidoreductase
MTGRVEGKVAFVTGAARGQGRSHAVRLAREGADIIAIDICAQIPSVDYPMPTEDDLAHTAALVEETGRRIVYRIADARDYAAVASALDDGVAQLGRLDIAVINHGIASFGRSYRMSEDMWDDMIAVNLTGAWKCVKAAVPHLIDGGRGGAIVMTTSGAADLAVRNIAHYSAAKAGVNALDRTLALELGPQGIRVNVMCPGTVATTMVLNDRSRRLFRPDLENPTDADVDPVFRDMMLLPHGLIPPDDVSDTLMYLVSDESKYMTGGAVSVTGGGGVK